MSKKIILVQIAIPAEDSLSLDVLVTVVRNLAEVVLRDVEKTTSVTIHDFDDKYLKEGF
jgi:hypothetical protein